MRVGDREVAVWQDRLLPTPEEWKNATLSTWRSLFGEEDDGLLSSGVLRVEAQAAARDLLGRILVSEVGNRVVWGVVVETEAYLGPQDPASHAAARIGPTTRNRSMFGPAGSAYVFRSYGIHWCLNVVTGDEGFPAAVLIRGVDPIRGRDVVRHRRRGRKPLCAGPGRVGQALGISEALDGHPLSTAPLQLLAGWQVPDQAVGVSGRIGIRHAADWPLRFYLRGHPQVTRASARVMNPNESTESDEA